MEKLILAIDQGTTGSTILLINQRLEIVDREYQEILPSYPQPGWVEHDPNQIWEGTIGAAKRLVERQNGGGRAVVAIGITNQRETVCAWNPRSMIPYGKAIVWQCRRTSEACQELRRLGHEPMVRERTGLVLDPYFSASKIRWLLDHQPGLREKAQQGQVVFGTIDTFLLHRLTLGQALKTDVTNASRTSLMNLKTLAWDADLLSLFGIPQGVLPEIASSSEVYGKTKGLQFLPDGIPVAGMIGDQQAALLGQICDKKGDAKITYGTGCFLLVNTGSDPVASKNQLLTTLAWKIGNDTSYALEGSAFMGGATVQWLRDGLGIIKSSAEVETLAESAREEDMGDLSLVPAMTGLGAPYWDAEARGIISGITRGTTKAHIARAALAGIAHQNDDLLRAMAADLGAALRSVKVDGGAAQNNLLMQMQCDLAGVPLVRPKNLETTAYGAAIAAGLAVGLWKDIDAVRTAWKMDREFHPAMADQEVRKKRKRWENAIAKSRLR